jgi:hypothetical protein
MSSKLMQKFRWSNIRMDRWRTHSSHVVCFMQRKHTDHYVCQEQRKWPRHSLHYTFPVWSKFFYFKRKNQSRFLSSDSVLDPVKVNYLSEAHCDRQKSSSHNLTLPFMTSKYLRLLYRGVYSSHNDTVTKNKEIYSSLTILNYCQQWYGLSPFIKLWQENRKRTEEEKKTKTKMNLLRLFYENLHRRSTCEMAVKFKTCQLGMYFTRHRYVY